MGGVKTPHGEISPGPCRCLTEGAARWWTEDPKFAVEFFTFGYDHPWSSEDVAWALETRREGPPPRFYTFGEHWDSAVGAGYGPLHGPALRADTPGDTDRDGDIDHLDYLTIKRNFGTVGATWLDGDCDGDKDVDFDDYAAARDTFRGLVATGADGLATGAVPEPATLSLLAMAGLSLARRRIRWSATRQVGR
jgi:hypothetical protein